VSVRIPRDAPANFPKNGRGTGVIVGKLDFDEIPINSFTVFLYFEAASKEYGIVFHYKPQFRIIRDLSRGPSE
jgi:hypothetical protein